MSDNLNKESFQIPSSDALVRSMFLGAFASWAHLDLQALSSDQEEILYEYLTDTNAIPNDDTFVSLRVFLNEEQLQKATQSRGKKGERDSGIRLEYFALAR